MTELFVIDTSALISAHLIPHSVSRKAYDLALTKGIVVFSASTFHEFAVTFSREKFERYQALEERLKMISLAEQKGLFVEVSLKLSVCRDPNDDMFLELAKPAKQWPSFRAILICCYSIRSRASPFFRLQIS